MSNIQLADLGQGRDETLIQKIKKNLSICVHLS